MRLLILAGCGFLSACDGASESSQTLSTGITISGHFGEDGYASEDVSGMACDWQNAGDEMRCLVIEDEGTEAQWVSYDGRILQARERFDLIAAATPLGNAPQGICEDVDPAGTEFDGEAAALSDGVFYVTGSHGCSREGDEFRPAQFVVARIAPDDPGVAVQPGTVNIETSYRLSDLMQRDPSIARYFGTSLNRGNGLNVEGLAVSGDRMIFGLRAPVVDGQAYMFETTATALFSREIAGTGRAVPIALGPYAGIRDLAFLPDGRLLILSGPAQDQDVPYRIHLQDRNGAVVMLEAVTPPYGGKAEAIAVVGVDGASVSLLVMFDGVDDGGPRLITLDVGI